MTRAKKTVAKSGGGGKAKFKFILFIADSETNSALARKNLQLICREHLQDRYAIEIIDVFQDLDAALKHNILITPTLIKVTPGPPVIVFGNLSDPQKVLASLGL